jgi:flavodoxin
MKIAIVSYSFTGNNKRFAAYLSRLIPADIIPVTPLHPVTYGSITLDLVLSRKPKTDFSSNALSSYDAVLLIAPIWMGQIAFPMRGLLDALRTFRIPYAFLSVSGGADGENPNITAELTRRTGRAAAFVLDQHIRSLLPAVPAPTRDDTSKYSLTEADCELFAQSALEKIRLSFPNAQ